jgi:hypothetical protein
MDDHLSRANVAIGLKRRTSPNRASNPPQKGHDLAALQQTGFTSLPGHPGRLGALTALVSPLPHECAAVSFLWHFPYSYPRLPLATVPLYAVRTFLATLAGSAITSWPDIITIPD